VVLLLTLRGSANLTATKITAKTPAGILAQKAHCQPSRSAIKPPANGPKTLANTCTTAIIPIALPRSLTGNKSLIMAIAAGATAPAPNP